MEAHDVTDFGKEVIEESYKIPVLVDFWAQWCGPCRILGPTLEKLAKQAEGRWILRKLNVDEHQDISLKYQVRGIPAVKLFKNGNVIAEFTGALPEIQVSNWLKSNIPSENDDKAGRALLFLENGNLPKAKALLEDILKNEPNHAISAFFLGKILLFNEPDSAMKYFSVSEKNPEFLTESVYFKKLAQLISSGRKKENFADSPVKGIFLDGIDALTKREFSRALEKFIEVIMKNKNYENESAREACIAIFYYLGQDHELTKRYRRRFDMALY